MSGSSAGGRNGCASFEQQDIAASKIRGRDCDRCRTLTWTSDSAVLRDQVELGIGDDANGADAIVGADHDARDGRAVVDVCGTKH